jgi:hypothetical protein
MSNSRACSGGLLDFTGKHKRIVKVRSDTGVE